MNKDEKRNPNEPATGSDRTSAKEVAHEVGLTDNYGVKKPMTDEEKKNKEENKKK